MSTNGKRPLLRGHYPFMRDWIAAAGLKPDKWLLQCPMPAQPVELKRPIGLERPIHWRLQQVAGVGSGWSAQSVAIIPQGKVCGIHADIATPDNRLILEFSQRPQPELLADVWKQGEPPLRRTAETVAVIAQRTSGAYFHWMLDVLPTLHILRQCGIEADKYVIHGKRTAAFHYETLAALGISRSRVIESDDLLHLQAGRLVIPKLQRELRPKWATDYLRRSLMTGKGFVSRRPGRRLYISRANAGKRRLLNEAEIMPLLKRYGFQSVQLELLPFERQVELFASAQAIAGPHGSGFTNMVFSPPGTTVIELFSPLYIHTFFPILSSILGHRHYYLVGEGERPPQGTLPPNGRPDMTIRPQHLERLLQLAGL